MRSPPQRPLERAAFLGFIVLFPGFVLYNYAVASHWMPPYLGGLFGPVCAFLAVFALFVIAGFFQERGAGVSLLEWGFAALALYVLLWTLASAALIGDKPYVGKAVKEALATLMIWLAAFFVGSRITTTWRTRVGVLGAWFLLIGGLLIHAMAVQRSFIAPFMLFHGERDADNESSTYQSIGRSILVAAIVLAPLQPRMWRHLLVLGSASVALLAIGSRAHLFSCILLIAALTALLIFRRRNWAAALLFVVAIAVLSDVLLPIFMDTRASEIFELGSSTSWQARLEAQERALEVILQNPLLGDFGYHHREGVAYSHNALSAWAGFGAWGFFLYVGLIVYSLTLAAERIVLGDSNSPSWWIAFHMNLAALILAAATEAVYASVLPALGWGAVASALREERLRQVLLHDYMLRGRERTNGTLAQPAAPDGSDAPHGAGT